MSFDLLSIDRVIIASNGWSILIRELRVLLYSQQYKGQSSAQSHQDRDHGISGFLLLLVVERVVLLCLQRWLPDLI